MFDHCNRIAITIFSSRVMMFKVRNCVSIACIVMRHNNIVIGVILVVRARACNERKTYMAHAHHYYATPPSYILYLIIVVRASVRRDNRKSRRGTSSPPAPNTLPRASHPPPIVHTARATACYDVIFYRATRTRRRLAVAAHLIRQESSRPTGRRGAGGRTGGQATDSVNLRL